jgi:hypothetical protein
MMATMMKMVLWRMIKNQKIYQGNRLVHGAMYAITDIICPLFLGQAAPLLVFGFFVHLVPSTVMIVLRESVAITVALLPLDM